MAWFRAGGGVDTSQVNAVASDIRSGKKIVDANGNEITGNVASRNSASVTSSNNVVSIPAGIYDSAVSKTVGTATSGGTTTLTASSPSFEVASGAYLTSKRTVSVPVYSWS